MNRCPLTYREISAGLYSRNGIKQLNSRLITLLPLDYTKEELLEEAAARSGKISLEGVQPKLSAILSIPGSSFVLTDMGGKYIIKPQQTLYTALPENEDLTMRLASLAGIEVPQHGLIYDKTGTLHYFIKRFDRMKKDQKYAVEDFAQLSGKNRNTKYNSSMEKVAGIVEKYCSFPMIEKIKLFKLTLFNFLTGNEDMHLKNYSLITKDEISTLTPAYDLLNTTIVIKNAAEEIALPLRGRKRSLTRKDLVTYFASECMGLNNRTIEIVLEELLDAITSWENEIEISFLSNKMKDDYFSLLQKRRRVIGLA
ncbi:MAG: HipA domain-containing protein [Ignavibacteriales bacterium]|nr:HipA domain-containing protein [Ignavibacteriales bacterium]